MKRREFITLIGGAVATWPLAVRAQHSAMPVIGFLGPAPAAAYLPRLEALRAGLRDLGYVEGKNIVIEFRWAERVDQLPEMAAELVGMKVDIILVSSSTYVEPARQATKTIPIVFLLNADPVGLGHVALDPNIPGSRCLSASSARGARSEKESGDAMTSKPLTRSCVIVENASSNSSTVRPATKSSCTPSF
jgi:putative ABC transport system substrate-binding protein